MKIRIKGNSIRFRPVQSEVKKLTETGSIAERTRFESHSLAYAVKVSGEEKELTATVNTKEIIINVPKSQMGNWYFNRVVGFNNVQKLSGNRTLSLLQEKDLACLDNRLEDQIANNPNPKANA